MNTNLKDVLIGLTYSNFRPLSYLSLFLKNEETQSVLILTGNATFTNIFVDKTVHKS